MKMKFTAVLVTFLLIICKLFFVNSEYNSEESSESKSEIKSESKSESDNEDIPNKTGSEENFESVYVNIPAQGKVLGTLEDTSWTKQTYMSFLGIPYAESPSGDLRFKPPVSKRPWSEPWDATKFGRRCPVITFIRNMRPAELKQDLEDCLNLCVYTKSLSELQPVMFYIHGGGFINGSNIYHPPKYLLEKDVVLVVPNYRIGALGWLSDLSENLPGNLPILDILLALEWVQDHIKYFGGNPEKITIFGQNAGAALTGAVLLSPLTPKDIFKGAIMQSGSILAEWAINNQPKRQTFKIGKALKCKDRERYKCLNKVSVLELLKATEKRFFSPIVGDFFGVLPDQPIELFRNFTRTFPIMTGFTKDDGSFVLLDYYDDLKNQKKDISSLTVREFAEGIMKWSKEVTGVSRNLLMRTLFKADQLESTNHKGAISAYFDLASILFVKSPIIAHTSDLVENKNANTYMYSFDYEGEYTYFGSELGNEHYPFNGGVYHSNDNIYLFSTHNLNAEDTEIAKNIVSIWTSFAIGGVPRTMSGIVLNPLLKPEGPYFVIGTEITMGHNVLEELTSATDDPDAMKLIRPDITF